MLVDIVADHEVGGGAAGHEGVQAGQHLLEGVGVQPVVAVHHLVVEAGGVADALVDALAVAAVLLMDGLDDGGVLGGVLVADGGGLVLHGTVVHEDDLGLLPGGEQRFDAVAHICRRVVARDGEGDQFLSHTKYSFALFRQMRKAGAGMEICTHIIAFLCRKCYRTWEMSEMFYNYPGSCGILNGL